MAGDEPPDPLTPREAARLLDPYLTEGRPAVLAVSGGPDSVALMGFAAALVTRAPNSHPLFVATVDHGLRPDSRAEAETVARWAADLGLPHRILTWTGGKPATRIQERARDARYELLFGFAREIGASCLLTAHTLDDQAETVLMRLVAGSGIDGLAGMPAQSGGDIRLCRPFLDLPKARLVATCAAEGWRFLDDPSNADHRFGRVRLRAVMAELSGHGLTPKRLARLSARAYRVTDALEQAAELAFERLRLPSLAGEVALDGARLARESDEVSLRVLRRAIDCVVPDGPRTRLSRLERFNDEIRTALRDGRAFQATLVGTLCQVRPDKRVVLRREPARRTRPPQP